MKVLFKQLVQVDGRAYPAETVMVSDRLMYDAKFKELIRSGVATILPRTKAQQDVQAGKDHHAHRMAVDAHAKARAVTAEEKRMEAALARQAQAAVAQPELPLDGDEEHA